MIPLTNPGTADKLEVILGQAVNVDTLVSFVDHTTSDDNVEAQQTEGHSRSTAATHQLCAGPSSGKIRAVIATSIRNTHATSSVDVTVQMNQNGTIFTIHKVTLRANEMLSYEDKLGWFTYASVKTPNHTYAYLTGNLASTTSTTLADATGLALPVLSGEYYRFKFMLLYQSAATTTGLKASVTVPSVTQFAAVMAGLVSTAAGGTANIFFDHITSSGDAVTATGTPAAGTTHLVTIDGVIVPSANGNVQAQVASEVNASGVTIMQGSLGILERVS